MALTVETGEGVADADSYATLTAATAYWTNRPHSALATAWAAETVDANKEGALREASAYLDAVYARRYRGMRKGYVQGLEWPRLDAIDDAGYPLPNLPPQLINATIELAGRAITQTLKGDLARGGRVRRQSVSGAVSREFFDDAPTETTFGVVADMLTPILQSVVPGYNWR